MQMKQISRVVSVIGLFLVAVVGWMCGLTPLAICIRALVGAAGLYVVVLLCTRGVMLIMANAIVKNKLGREDKGETVREHRD